MKKILFLLIIFFLVSGANALESYFKFKVSGVKKANISDEVEITFTSNKKLKFYSGKIEMNDSLKLISYSVNDNFIDESEIDEEKRDYFLKIRSKSNADYVVIKVKVKLLDTKREYSDIALRFNSGRDSLDDIIAGQNTVHSICVLDTYNKNQRIYVYGSLVFGLAIFVFAFYFVFIKKSI